MAKTLCCPSARTRVVALGCRPVASLPSLNTLYRFLTFYPATLTLTQIVGVSPECWLDVLLKIFPKFLDFPFQRLSFRAGHPMFTSLSTQKKPYWDPAAKTLWRELL